MKKSIYRTVITMVILSEEPIGENETLASIMYESDEGSYIGSSTNKTEKKLVGKTAVIEIEKAGSSPEFFNMDAQGYSLDEEMENAVIEDEY